MIPAVRAFRAAVCAVSIAACSHAPQTSEPQPEMRAGSLTPACVVLPDLRSLAESVQKQIRDRHEVLGRTLERKDASSQERAEAYGALGRVLMAAKFNDRAVECFGQAEAVAPADLRWPYYQGHAFLRQGDRAHAAAAFERAVKIRPDDLPALIWLGETYLDDERFDLAQHAYQHALAIQPQSAPALFGVGRTALASQHFADAVVNLERALAADPRASAVHYPLAMAYRALGDQNKADTHLGQRGGSYPTFPDPLMHDDEELLESAVSFEDRGMQALRSGDFASAITDFRHGLSLDANDVSIRYWLGAALYASGDPDGAVREFSEVLRREPAHAKAHFSLGAIYDAQHDRRRALSEYQAAVEADPNMPEARLRLAEDLRAEGSTNHALEHYEAAVKLDPTIVDAWIGGARALIQLGRKDAARRWLDDAKRVFPNRPELIQLESSL